jgi:hypothetical protein
MSVCPRRPVSFLVRSFLPSHCSSSPPSPIPLLEQYAPPLLSQAGLWIALLTLSDFAGRHPFQFCLFSTQAQPLVHAFAPFYPSRYVVFHAPEHHALPIFVSPTDDDKTCFYFIVKAESMVGVWGTCACSFCTFFNFVCMATLAFSITLQRQDKSQEKTLEKQ